MTTETEWAGPASVLLRTLASDTRLLILQHLRDEARTADALARLIGVSKAGLTAHLQRLVRDNLVTMRRQKPAIYALARDDVFIVVDAARGMFEGRK